MAWDGKERRRFVRDDFPCKIIVYTPKQHVLVVHTENISCGGVKVILEEKLPISSVVGLELYLGRQIISCKGRVVWVVENVDPVAKVSLLFDTGIEFYEIDEKDETMIKNIIDAIMYGKG